MKRLCLLLTVLFAGCDAGSSPPAPKPKPAAMVIELKDVTYAELDRLVAAQKGQVVAIDVWSTSCAPCLKKFPSFVELHKQHAAQGLVCISLSTDFPEDAALALKFLEASRAEFANYRLSESHETVEPTLGKKYPTEQQPIMFVFNRKGEKVKEFTSKHKPEQIDTYIRQLLDEK